MLMHVYMYMWCRFDAIEPPLEQDGTAEQELQLAEARYELASCSSYLTKAHGDLIAVLCTDESSFAALHGQGGMLEDKQVTAHMSMHTSDVHVMHTHTGMHT